MSKINVLIAGATGYLGNELIKILINHKQIKIKYLCGNSSIGKKISDFDKTIKHKLPNISKITKSKINECSSCGAITFGLNETCINCGADLENISKYNQLNKKPSESTIEVQAEEVK